MLTTLETFLFFIGATIQSHILLYPRPTKKESYSIIGTGTLFATIFMLIQMVWPGKKPEFTGFFFLALLIALFAYTLHFQKRILPKISDADMITWSIIFLYIVHYLYPSQTVLQIILVVYVVFFIITGLLRITKKSNRLQIFNYIAFITMAVVFAIIQIKMHTRTFGVPLFDNGDGFLPIGNSNALSSGFISIYIFCYASFLIRIMPPFKRHQLGTWQKDVRELFPLFEERYVEANESRLYIILAMVATFAFCGIALFFKISPWQTVSVIFLLLTNREVIFRSAGRMISMKNPEMTQQ